jgi:hypothetical protein
MAQSVPAIIGIKSDVEAYRNWIKIKKKKITQQKNPQIVLSPLLSGEFPEFLHQMAHSAFDL